MTEGPEWDFAFCAPGGLPLAEAALAVSGDRAREVREHPWLTGLKPGQVLLVRGEAEGLDEVLAAVFAEPPPGRDRLPAGWDWWHG